ncbi:hypothetical protein QOZ80_5AG0372450 [Eleusine coracana subsp. coracana]|nr:hypothetical protein QOZ80_5AG0372450 [Eleusine coracana subsp. coracana]
MAASSCPASLGFVLVLLALAGAAHGHPPVAGSALSSRFYDASCPRAYDIVQSVIQNARVTDPRIPASLIRLHFHDCFVNGCDGSLLLDDDLPAIESEKNVPANENSARGFPVVDDIKRALEKACPGIVSCADILALAAEISVELAGGPRWRVLLGRRDGTTTNIESANNLPNFFDPLDVLQKKFRDVNLDDTDLVALQGAHTFGKVHCEFTRQNCTRGQAEGTLENLDQVTPKTFDNKYYDNILKGRAQLDSDQVMLSDPAAAATTAPIVHRFAANQKDFFRNFAVSMIKMGNISPLTGKDEAHDIVQRVIQNARVTDLHFHDCFVNGCDGSILLDDDLPVVQSEKNVLVNKNSVCGFTVVDDIKSALERACPSIVSSTDILALAAEISVKLAGGPSWRVLLGCRDRTMTNIESANNLPKTSSTPGTYLGRSSEMSTLTTLTSSPSKNCMGRQAEDTLENLDQVTPKTFDNKYYDNLLQLRA